MGFVLYFAKHIIIWFQLNLLEYWIYKYRILYCALGWNDWNNKIICPDYIIWFTLLMNHKIACTIIQYIYSLFLYIFSDVWSWGQCYYKRDVWQLEKFSHSVILLLIKIFYLPCGRVEVGRATTTNDAQRELLAKRDKQRMKADLYKPGAF